MTLALAWLAACSLHPPEPTHAWRAELRGAAATAAVDAPRIADRLARFGGEVRARPSAPDRIELQVAGNGVPPSALPRVLAPGVFRVGEGPDALGNAHLREASVVSGFDGRPGVRVELTEAGARAFCALSTVRVGQELEVAVDGVVLMAPRVQEPICGGALQIDLGGAADPSAEAFALAAALRPDALAGAWSLEVLDAARP